MTNPVAPIIYLFFGTGTGTLGTMPFSNASFLISVPTDTSRIITNSNLYPPGTPMADSARATSTITILNLGTEAFQISLSVAVLRAGTPNTLKVSLGLAPYELLGIASPDLQGYGLNHSLGPISGGVSFASQPPFPAASGNLVFSSIASASFQAIVPGAATPPKPAPVA